MNPKIEIKVMGKNQEPKPESLPFAKLIVI